MDTFSGGRQPGGFSSGDDRRRNFAFGVNKVILIGSLVFGPTDRHDGSIVTLGITTGHESLMRLPSGQDQKFRETYEVVVYGSSAKYLLSRSSELRKGTWLYIEGRLRRRAWIDTNTQSKRTAYDVVANRIIILNKMIHAWEMQAAKSPEERFSRAPSYGAQAPSMAPQAPSMAPQAPSMGVQPPEMVEAEPPYGFDESPMGLDDFDGAISSPLPDESFPFSPGHGGNDDDTPF